MPRQAAHDSTPAAPPSAPPYQTRPLPEKMLETTPPSRSSVESSSRACVDVAGAGRRSGNRQATSLMVLYVEQGYGAATRQDRLILKTPREQATFGA